MASFLWVSQAPHHLFSIVITIIRKAVARRGHGAMSRRHARLASRSLIPQLVGHQRSSTQPGGINSAEKTYDFYGMIICLGSTCLHWTGWLELEGTLSSKYVLNLNKKFSWDKKFAECWSSVSCIFDRSWQDDKSVHSNEFHLTIASDSGNEY